MQGTGKVVKVRASGKGKERGRRKEAVEGG